MKQVNDFETYPYTSVKRGEAIGISPHKTRALASHLGIKSDGNYHKNVRHEDGSMRDRYLKAALDLMKDQAKTVD